MDYLSFATNNSTLPTSNVGKLVEPQPFHVQRQFAAFNGFHCVSKNGCDQNGFRSFANCNERKRSLDGGRNGIGSEEIKRKKVSQESESLNNGDGDEHGLELQRPTRALNVDSHLLPIESGHQNWSDDGFNMNEGGYDERLEFNPQQFVPAYNTSSLEHETTVDAVLGYDSLYLYNATIAEMHGC